MAPFLSIPHHSQYTLMLQSWHIFILYVFHTFSYSMLFAHNFVYNLLKFTKWILPSEVKGYLLHKVFHGTSCPLSQSGTSSLCIIRRHCFIIMYCKSMPIAPNNYLRPRTLFHYFPISNAQNRVGYIHYVP